MHAACTVTCKMQSGAVSAEEVAISNFKAMHYLLNLHTPLSMADTMHMTQCSATCSTHKYG